METDIHNPRTSPSPPRLCVVSTVIEKCRSAVAAARETDMALCSFKIQKSTLLVFC